MTYSTTTYRTLRNTRLLDKGELDGKRFIRCIPPHGLSASERTEVVLLALREIGEPGLCLASNPDFGGDYLRVETHTATYALVCQMLS
jgi:hypothetical protein